MNVQPLEIEELQVKPLKQLDERLRGHLGDVLVVDTVELVVSHDLQGVRNFDYEDALVGEKGRDALHERVKVANVV